MKKNSRSKKPQIKKHVQIVLPKKEIKIIIEPQPHYVMINKSKKRSDSHIKEQSV